MCVYVDERRLGGRENGRKWKIFPEPALRKAHAGTLVSATMVKTAPGFQGARITSAVRK